MRGPLVHRRSRHGGRGRSGIRQREDQLGISATGPDRGGVLQMRGPGPSVLAIAAPMVAQTVGVGVLSIVVISTCALRGVATAINSGASSRLVAGLLQPGDAGARTQCRAGKATEHAATQHVRPHIGCIRPIALGRLMREKGECRYLRLREANNGLSLSSHL
jgi:hypothetical protein